MRVTYSLLRAGGLRVAEVEFLVHIGLLVAGVVPLDLFLEARYRAYGLDTLWMYTNRMGCWAEYSLFCGF